MLLKSLFQCHPNKFKKKVKYLLMVFPVIEELNAYVVWEDVIAEYTPITQSIQTTDLNYF